METDWGKKDFRIILDLFAIFNLNLPVFILSGSEVIIQRGGVPLKSFSYWVLFKCEWDVILTLLYHAEKAGKSKIGDNDKNTWKFVYTKRSMSVHNKITINKKCKSNANSCFKSIS